MKQPRIRSSSIISNQSRIRPNETFSYFSTGSVNMQPQVELIRLTQAEINCTCTCHPIHSAVAAASSAATTTSSRKRKAPTTTKPPSTPTPTPIYWNQINPRKLEVHFCRNQIIYTICTAPVR